MAHGIIGQHAGKCDNFLLAAVEFCGRRRKIPAVCDGEPQKTAPKRGGSCDLWLLFFRRCGGYRICKYPAAGLVGFIANIFYCL